MRCRIFHASLALFVLSCGTDGASTFDGGTRADGAGGGSLGGGGDGGGTLGGGGSDGGAGADADAGCGPNLVAVLRDFHDTHPDFEKFLGDDRGIVAAMLGSDDKPVYANAAGTTPTTTGKSDFDQWYRDTPNINVSSQLPLMFTKGANGISTFDQPAYFPLDGLGFGNEGRDHNFHFTTELHTEFVYQGGEVFTFTGDDDLWTFINGHLAIDLGGVHVAETQSVDLDTDAKSLGIVKGTTYPLAVFSAERHTSESHFRIDTTIEFTNCHPILR